MPRGKNSKPPSVLGKLSEYELARLERIRQINAAMEKFDLKKASEDMTREKRDLEQTQKRKRVIAHRRRQILKRSSGKNTSPVRRSGRVRNKPAQYRPEDLDDILVQRALLPKPRRKRQAMVIPNLSDDQRKRLSNAENWLEEFEEFLLRIPHGRNGKVISEQNARSVMRQVRVLVSGSGIYYKHWQEGIVCFKDRPVTLATDFVKLWEEAKEFENEHGEDRGHGWLMLHPITKLLCFQIHKVTLDEDDDEIAALEAATSVVLEKGEEEEEEGEEEEEEKGAKKKSDENNQEGSVDTTSVSGSTTKRQKRKTARVKRTQSEKASSPKGKRIAGGAHKGGKKKKQKKTFLVGDRVDVRWPHDGKWYEATITAKDPHGRFEVTYDAEGTFEDKVKAPRMRRGK
eukprot:g2163.t1